MFPKVWCVGAVESLQLVEGLNYPFPAKKVFFTYENEFVFVSVRGITALQMISSRPDIPENVSEWNLNTTAQTSQLVCRTWQEHTGVFFSKHSLHLPEL